MGYAEQRGVYRHPERQAVFCGDLIDRGPQIVDAVSIVRRMVEAQAAQVVMGNHEFNAIAWHTPRRDEPSEYFRRHTERTTHQHQATLDQFEDHDLPDVLDWFRRLPVALDLGAIRVVHACWDDACLQVIHETLQPASPFDDEFLTLALLKEAHPVRHAVERVLKGPEVRLPDGVRVIDKEGTSRGTVRIRWYEPADQYPSLDRYAFPDETRLSGVDIPTGARPCPYPDDAPPLFIGHYWLSPEHSPLLRPNIACLDLSVAKGGRLCAYRFDGESRLTPDHLMSVPSRDTAAVSG